MKSYPRYLNVFLAFQMAFSPLYGVAADLSVDAGAPASQRPTLDRAGNNVPIVQITRPSGGGVSMNRYGDFNVGREGLILNNTSQITQTQLGGYIEGNPNLSGTHGANIIVNQVGGGLPSQLRGYSEVAGRSAEVIIANPNGITCDGCGFINTPRGTLTTGVVGLRGDGSLGDIRVSQGLLRIDGEGLNADNIDRVDLLARAIEINAGLYAQDLNIVAGTNAVNYNSLDAKPIDGTGSAPRVALDVAGVGGMYANRIFMVGTEKGLGVNSEGVIATATGDLQLSADGTLSLGTTRSAGSTSLRSGSSDITLHNQSYSDQSLSLDASGEIRLTGSAGAKQGVTLNAGGVTVDQTGQLYSGFDADGARTGSGALSINSDRLDNDGQVVGRQVAVDGGSLVNNGELLQVGEGNVRIDLDAELINTGVVYAEGDSTTIRAAQIDNAAGASVGQASDGKLALEIAGHLANAGELMGNGDVAVLAATLDNAAGASISQAGGGELTVDVTGHLGNEGQIAGSGNVAVQAADLTNEGDATVGQSGEGQLVLDVAGRLANRGQLVGDGDVTIRSASLDNTAGASIGHTRDGQLALDIAGELGNQGQIAGNGDLSIRADQLDNQQGTIVSAKTLGIETESLDNRDGELASLHALTIETAKLNNARGSMKSNDELAIDTHAFTYQGDIDSASITVTAEGPVRIESGGDWRTSGDLNLNTLGAVVFNGKLQIAGNLSVDAASLAIGTLGLAASQGDGDFELSGTLDNRNRLSSASTLTVDAGRVLNYKDLGGRQADISAGRITNRGLLFGVDSLALNADYIENEMGGLSGSNAETGDIFSFGDLTLQGQNGGRAKLIRNRQGLIRAEGDIAINTDSLENLGDWTSGGMTTETGAYEYSHGRACYLDPRSRCLPSGERMPEEVRAFRTRTVREVALVDDYSPASLIAGGRLTGHASELSNVYSYIGAGDSIALNGSKLHNTAATTDVNVTTTRDSSYWKWKSHTLESDSRDNRDDPTVVLRSTETVTVAGATIEAGGNVSLNFSQKVNNGTTTNHVSAVSQTGVTKTPTTAVSAGNGVSVVSAGQLDGAAVVDPLAQNSFHLPEGSGLFVVNDNPNHPYLIETNPLLTDYASFTSSDYLLDRLDWDGAQYMRRIGDGFYEMTLVEQALQARTGSRLLDGQGGMAMFQQLMDNAVTAQADLDLTPGVALTKDQVNRLTHSLLWMEAREVNGEEVLVPVVYLSADRELAYDNGALIAGRDVTIVGDEGVVNAGAINALDTLALSSKNGGLLNREGRLQAGRQIDIGVARDIVNQSGEIKSGNVHLVAGGDIRNETLVDNVGSVDSFAISRKGQDASITADNNLTMSASGDVVDRAGKLEAGGNLAIAAGGDIRLESQKQVTGFNVGNRHNNQSLDQLEHLTSAANAGGDLSLNARNDIAIQGAQVSAARDAQLLAGGNIDVVAVADTSHSELHYRIKGRGFGSDKKVDKTSDSRVHKDAIVSAGGNLAVATGGDLQVYGSTMQGGEGVQIDAGGDIQLVAAVDQHQENVRKSEKNSVRRKDKLYGFHHETAVASAVTSGGDLSLDSGADIHITGSDLVAGDRLQIGGSLVDHAGDEYKTASGDNVKNLTVDAVALNNEEWAESSRSFTGIIKELAKVATYTVAGMMGAGMDTAAIELGSRKEDRVQQSTHQGAQLVASDIAVDVKDTARFLGATVSSNGELKVDAGAIQIDAVANTTSETHISEKETVKGLGATLGRDEIRVGGIEERTDRTTHTRVSTQWQGSRISAENVELNAGQTIEVTASEVASAGDLDMRAGESVQVGGRQDTEVTTDSQHTEIRTTSAAVKNAYVDAVYALKAINDARKSVDDAREALSDAKDRAERGEIRKQDLKYYAANLAAAEANLAQAGIALVAAGATAAASTGTGGFYATGSAERQTIDSSHTEQSASWNGSQLVAAAIQP